MLLHAPDQQRAKAAYERFLGRRIGFEPRVPNGAVQLGLPSWASRPGLVFSAQDYEGAVRLLNRRGLPLAPVDDARRTAAAVVNGLLLGVVERSSMEQAAGDDAPAGEIGAIDHVVVASTHLDRVVATFGGRLGLDLRLEQRVLKVAKQLFFRCQNTVLEVLVKPALPGKADEVWGVAWQTGDIEAAHRRLTCSGVPVSEIREGRKPGTYVATVKDPALATPTLLIEHRER